MLNSARNKLVKYQDTLNGCLDLLQSVSPLFVLTPFIAPSGHVFTMTLESSTMVYSRIISLGLMDNLA